MFLAWCLQQLNAPIPYVWGGKDPGQRPGRDWRVGGLDCSGFVTYPLQLLGGPDWRGTYNTDRLWTELPRVAMGDVMPGDLALYRGRDSKGSDDVEHVMVYVGSGGSPERGLVVGQARGGSQDVDPKVSRQLGRVTRIESLLYRDGFAGFTRLPLT
jgi:cell wall-associated NlpC family hydrolase